MSVHDEAILRMLAQMDARQARIEAMLAQVIGGGKASVEHDLVQQVADLTAGEWFAARELWATIGEMRTAAEATGEPVPDIAQAFDDLGLASTKSLGRWLAVQDPAVVQRTEKTRDGLLWRVVTLAG
ncbi:hypothetical protein E4L95_12365 [Paracoccus liaowanqingii]|uniref:Uncharacterized protein n=1 Tax=Paracoccus liaowanqingii TaxID=2560053 RepID=A0A4Z1CA29_9RHOB|nr:hypothetical protein [Paracoccus liaowanqingii]TGN58597.1 hypothetical protein E4L95_12365 [Paracoccus liaowanqingii]